MCPYLCCFCLFGVDSWIARVWLHCHTVDIYLQSPWRHSPLSVKPHWWWQQISRRRCQVWVIEHKRYSYLCRIAAHFLLRGAGHVGTLTVVCVCVQRGRREDGEREGGSNKRCTNCETSETGLIRGPATTARLVSWGTPQPKVGGWNYNRPGVPRHWFVT